MKRLKLYLDTSVLGGLFDTEEPERVKTAEALLRSIGKGVYEAYISQLTIAEVSEAPVRMREILRHRISETGFQVLEETLESVSPAESYLADRAMPERYRDDARHVAIAVIHDLDYIVFWNYRHMVNISVRRLINSTNLRMGYNTIEIVSPEEVIGGGEMEIQVS